VLLVHNVTVRTFGLTFKLVGSVSRCMSLLKLKTYAIVLMLKSYVSERRKKLAEYASERNSTIGCKITEL
jgi:hypothetical protein